jgi:hypothetical protein
MTAWLVASPVASTCRIATVVAHVGPRRDAGSRSDQDEAAWAAMVVAAAGSRPIPVRKIGGVWLVSTAQVSENGGKARRAANLQARGKKWKPK